MMKIIVFCILVVSIWRVESGQAPEQVHLALTGVQGEMAVQWATLLPTKTDVVQYSKGSKKLNLQASGYQFVFTDGGTSKRNISLHNVKLTGLLPSSTYFYRVGDPASSWSDILQFQTFPTGYFSLEIGMYGDMGVNNSQALPYVQDEVEQGTLDMIIHVGDMAYNMDDNQGQVGDEFMRQIEPIANYVPYMVCVGNHEFAYNYSHYSNRLSGITGQSSGSNTNWFFSYDISYVHFVAFSSEVYFQDYLNQSVVAQYNWLKQDLQKANANRAKTPWIIAYAHRPVYCSNVDDIPDCTADAQTLRRGVNGQYSIEDLLAEYNVDIYFSAHEHSYERTWPVYRGVIDKDQENHTYVNPKYPVYIINGAGGCQEYLDWYDEVFYGPWSVTRSSSYGYGHLSIQNATHLLWRQYLSNGDEGMDTLQMVKDASLKNGSRKTPSSVSVSDCDAYCYHVCTSGGIISDCLGKCGCKELDLETPEFVSAVKGIRKAMDLVPKKHK